ncbi:dienelactone hydrolase family protein [Marinobacter salinisoli]|uniref:Dienelactone hydrolase family protein n=1 Tax=Marinobacter salinisoli TaxID=2769486 RepID=A0ABX7MSL0_9GAMM|nr:dienelactone hydrolase family protein [Marinobacter salinisoli]QSP95293.1 dienelactone hydrolase family protein [Marinobacter salinisoli]
MTRLTAFASAAAITLALTSHQAVAEMKTEIVDYQIGDETFSGFMAWDDSVQGKRPGILLVHEWWGHNDFVRDQAKKLARAGYTAFALDMYGKGKLAEHPDTAKQFMQEATSNFDQIKNRFLAAKELLEEHETVDGDQIAAQGYCFGGAVVLNMARSGADLDGVVSYHGSLSSPMKAEQGKVNARIQVYTGGADKMVPAEQVAGLVEEMQQAGVDLTLVTFPDVLHSFTNPGADEYAEQFGLPVGYDEEAAMRSWQGTLDFYNQIFDQ